ncbi:TnsA endonuclease C-terminal domain-containing protein [Endozoicomonas ascidiicola]|uniref:TnsA endonuclease C-terminal domain-containing protein n=1 Tax=Endozoicomonas ascidiicola TaxID=1698521 RepID=UPI0008368181|nr:TnsA endonuclease C-terminal domain-containing protein [Endozoicomonas ascidiicola]
MQENKDLWKETFLSEVDGCSSTITLKEVIDAVSLELNMQSEQSVKIFRHLMWHKELKADVSKKILLTTKVGKIEFDLSRSAVVD